MSQTAAAVPSPTAPPGAAEPAREPAALPEGRLRFFDEPFLRKLDRLRLVSLKMHGSASHGGRRSRRRGTSVEFADYREYTRGDDLRQIDWNIYGRSDRLYVKLREDEESLAVHLLLDCSRSMDWGQHNKLAYAKQVAAALAYVGLASLDRVAIAAFSHRLLAQHPLTRGRGQALRLVAFLDSLRPARETDLRPVLRAYAALHPRSGLVIILSDFLFPGALEGLPALLDRGHEVVLLHLLDPWEIDPPLGGELELVDHETRQTLPVGLDGVALDAYRRRLSAWQGEIAAFCARRMVRYHITSTATPLEELLFRQLRARRILS